MRGFRRLGALLVPLALVAAAACGDDDGADGDGGGGDGDAASITIYSGRSEELVGPILERFEEATGITVDARYGDTAEMAATILEEGSGSPADVYFGQDAGALGALSQAEVLATLDDAILGEVPAEFRSPSGEWVGVSGRARVVAYNTDELAEDDLPDSILDYTDPEWSGRIGWAPTNGSFQAFVTALRVLLGEDGARDWLEGIAANDPVAFEDNTSAVEGVAAGEVDVAFVNHYYLYRFLAEDADYPVANKYYTDGDPGALVNVAGVGILASSEAQDDAEQLVEYLLSEEGQTYFAEETFELPLVPGIEPDDRLPDVESLQQPELDLDDLEDLEGTLALLTDVGLV